MSVKIEDLEACNSAEEFYAELAKCLILTRIKETWEIGCECGDPACFAHTWVNLATHEYVERDDMYELIRRWGDLLILTFEEVDRVIKQWIDDFRDIRARRCVLELEQQRREGKDIVVRYEWDGVVGEAVFRPEDPLPDDLLKQFKRYTTLN